MIILGRVRGVLRRLKASSAKRTPCVVSTFHLEWKFDQV